MRTTTNARIPFGKFRGSTLTEVPDHYLRRLVNHGRLSIRLSNEIREYLNMPLISRKTPPKRVQAREKKMETKFPFGRFKGAAYEKAPEKYLIKMLQKTHLPDVMRENIEKALLDKIDRKNRKVKMHNGPYKGTPIEDIPYRYLKYSISPIKNHPKHIRKEIDRVLELRKNEEIPPL